MPPPAPSDADLIFGTHPGRGLVAVEHEPSPDGDAVRLYVRAGDAVRETVEPFHPYLWAEAAPLLAGGPEPLEVQALQGSGALRVRAVYRSWKDLERAAARLKKSTGFTPTDPEAPYFLVNDPVQQFLMASGRTFFKGMNFGDLRRLQLDIETATAEGFEFSNAEREDDRILAIGLADSTGWSAILAADELDEKTMLERCLALVAERDPDVLEGHNLFAFDLDYLAKRAARHGVPLALGRGGRLPAVRPGRFTAGERTTSYPRFDLPGRSVLDTYFLVQIYDLSTRELPSFGLKEAARHFGLAAPDRTYVDGGAITAAFRDDPARVKRYLADDVRETGALARLLSPVYFAQAGIIPFTYQNIGLRGTAAKIDALLLRAALQAGRAVPRPDTPRAFEGGYTDLFFTGVARDVQHCDVRSLYPSLMLRERIGPRADDAGVFLRLLEHLRARRLQAKDAARAARAPEERLLQEALQGTFKILINSFYGYLGFAQARYSDFDAAERVAARGREILKSLLAALRATGGAPIETDTDGIYFTPPPDADRPEALERFRDRLRAVLPEGIEIEFDGDYEAMFSYKRKNYALLDRSGEIALKGAALKSRGLEPFQRRYVEEWVALRLRGRDNELPALTARYRRAILDRAWPIAMLAKTERLTEAPEAYAAKQQAAKSYAGKPPARKPARNAACELALASGRAYRAGDAISYYVTGEKKTVKIHEAARLVRDWNPARRDENVAFYLAKLDDLTEKLAAADGSDRAQGELDLGGAAAGAETEP